jgi:hypothetical protein
MSVLAMKLMIVGVLCIALGIWSGVDALTNGIIQRDIGGMGWYGLILAIAGVAAYIIGNRMMREEDPPADDLATEALQGITSAFQ